MSIHGAGYAGYQYGPACNSIIIDGKSVYEPLIHEWYHNLIGRSTTHQSGAGRAGKAKTRIGQLEARLAAGLRLVIDRAHLVPFH